MPARAYSNGSQARRERYAIKYGDTGTLDVVNGLYNGGVRRAVNKFGGKALIDFDRPMELTDWFEFSKIKMEQTLANNKTARFVMDGVDNKAAFNSGSEFYTSLTSKELRYIRDNWTRFKDNVQFVKFDKKWDQIPWEEL